jgi:long-chain acyl-CoA synthetase
VLVVGDGHPFPAALIAPNWELVRSEFSIPADVPTAAIAQRTDVEDFIRKQATEMSADLAPFEQIRRIALLPRDLTIEDGELSPTLKVKRRVVESRYANLIERAYAERELVKK